MKLTIADSRALPIILGILFRSVDVHVGAELQGAEFRRLRMLLSGQVTHAGQIQDVQRVRICESNDSRVSQVFVGRCAAFGLPFVAVGDAEKG